MFVRSSARLFSQTQRSVFAATPSVTLQFNNRYFCESKLKSPEEITTRVLQVVKNFEKVDEAKVNEKSHFVNDLGLDSLDNVELVLAIEEEFSIEIPDDASNNITSIPEAISYLATHPHIQ